MLVHGESNQEIAEDLGISAKTVGHHVQARTRRPAFAAGPRRRCGPSRTSSLIAHRAFAPFRPGVRGAPRCIIGVDRRRQERQRRRDVILATTTGGGFRPLRGASIRPKAPRSGSSTDPGARRSSAIRTRATGYGRSSTGMRTGWQSFASDPKVLGIMQEAGTRGAPQSAGLGGHYKTRSRIRRSPGLTPKSGPGRCRSPALAGLRHHALV